MWQDPIVEEIHHIREMIAKECNYDLRKIFERLKKNENQHVDRLFSKDDKKNKVVKKNQESYNKSVEQVRHESR